MIAELGKGEALVSVLEGNGVRLMVERALIVPPGARVGAITPGGHKGIMQVSPLNGKYEATIDRDSAFEMPQRSVTEETERPAQEEGGGLLGGVLGWISGSGSSNGRSSGRTTTTQAVIGSVAPTIATMAGREITQAIFSGILGGRFRL
jgi:hypothetical protein